MHIHPSPLLLLLPGLVRVGRRGKGVVEELREMGGSDEGRGGRHSTKDLWRDGRGKKEGGRERGEREGGRE